MIDFHCHLDLFSDPESVVERCEAEKIYVLSVTNTPSSWYGTKKLERIRIKTAIGLHPQVAHERKTELSLFDKILPETRYVGEIGLDGAPEFKKHREDQIAVFRHILNKCSDAGGKVLSIHSRHAGQAVLDELAIFPNAGVPVLHWFSGNNNELEEAIEIGCWFSVGPAMLISKRGRAAVEKMPKDRVLTESDGPFAKINGNAVSPWDINIAISILADIWKVDQYVASKILLDNLRNILQ